MLRFSKAPTKELSINELRVAILTYIVAQQKKDNFLIRIDDIDKDSIIEGLDSEIVQLLEKFALKDDRRFHQSENLTIHQTLALKLLKEKKAFISIDDRELNEQEIEALKRDKKAFEISIKMEQDNNKDKVCSFVILKKDSTPTKNFAIACDDIISDIDTIIDVKDNLMDIAKQQKIKSLLDYQKDTTHYFIEPIIFEQNEIRLQELFEDGFIPDAILNYLLLLGYSTPKEKIFTLPQAINWYAIDSISYSNLTFDIEELKLINQQHLLNMDDKELSKIFGFADADIGKLAKIYLAEAHTTKELDSKIKAIFAPKNFEGGLKDDIITIQNIIFDAPMFHSFLELKEYIKNRTEIEDEKLDTILSLLITGSQNDTKLNDIYPYIKSYLLEVIS